VDRLQIADCGRCARPRRNAGLGVISTPRPKPSPPAPTALELGASTGLFSLSSDGGGGEGRGEESRFYWISPPQPSRSCLAGRRRPTLGVPMLNSSAVPPAPLLSDGRGWRLLARGGEGEEFLRAFYPG
jgi:hypothetical protein